VNEAVVTSNIGRNGRSSYLRLVKPVLSEAAIVLEGTTLEGGLVHGEHLLTLSAWDDVVPQDIWGDLLTGPHERLESRVRRRKNCEFAGHQFMSGAGELKRGGKVGKSTWQCPDRVHDGSHAHVASAPTLHAS
jgi:hypothetical protein